MQRRDATGAGWEPARISDLKSFDRVMCLKPPGAPAKANYATTVGECEFYRYAHTEEATMVAYEEISYEYNGLQKALYISAEHAMWVVSSAAAAAAGQADGQVITGDPIDVSEAYLVPAKKVAVGDLIITASDDGLTLTCGRHNLSLRSCGHARPAAH